MHAELKRYQKAAADLLKSGEDVKALLKGIRSAMERRGHLKLYPAFLRSLIRVYPKVESREQAELIVAKEADGQVYKKQFSDAKITVDPTIIGGYVHIKDHAREDNSYKQKLLTWYRRATSTD